LPRYFFHLQTATRITDDVGLELPGLLDARAEAIRACGEMMRDGVDTFWGTRPWAITVTDGGGVILMEIETHGHSSVVHPDGALPDR